jgi:hypothetical protein
MSRVRALYDDFFYILKLGHNSQGNVKLDVGLLVLNAIQATSCSHQHGKIGAKLKATQPRADVSNLAL